LAIGVLGLLACVGGFFFLLGCRANALLGVDGWVLLRWIDGQVDERWRYAVWEINGFRILGLVYRVSRFFTLVLEIVVVDAME